MGLERVPKQIATMGEKLLALAHDGTMWIYVSPAMAQQNAVPEGWHQYPALPQPKVEANMAFEARVGNQVIAQKIVCGVCGHTVSGGGQW